jgi:hypothetical protein
LLVKQLSDEIGLHRAVQKLDEIQALGMPEPVLRLDEEARTSIGKDVAVSLRRNPAPYFPNGRHCATGAFRWDCYFDQERVDDATAINDREITDQDCVAITDPEMQIREVRLQPRSDALELG